MRLRDKIICFVCIVLAVGLIIGAGIQLDSINRQRQDMNLIIDTPENIPPSLAFATIATGAFRGLVVDILWMRADKLKEEGQFFDARQLAEWITILQPRFASVWEFHAWNMAYNISVAIPETQPDQRWQWVRNGYELIRDQATSIGQWTKEIINVLQGVRIPARIIWGIDITDSVNDAPLRPLLQVHNGKNWLTFNPETGSKGIPANYLVWKVGDRHITELEGGNDLAITFSVTRSYAELIDVARQGAATRDSFFSKFSLLSLPVQNQNVYQLLLMLPLGALLVVFLRTLVGLQTFGTFMPILIAMAFRETQLFWGVIMFSMIVSIGLMIRFYLEKLMLLLIPRLAAVLVIVVILMLLISLITNQLGIERLLSIALFPMVILAMTIERMSIIWEENGAREAILQGLGSLLVACLGYVVMTNENLMYLIFVFPELLLVVLGMCLWMGSYTGYRLVELVRFKGMQGKDAG